MTAAYKRKGWQYNKLGLVSQCYNEVPSSSSIISSSISSTSISILSGVDGSSSSSNKFIVTLSTEAICANLPIHVPWS